MPQWSWIGKGRDRLSNDPLNMSLGRQVQSFYEPTKFAILLVALIDPINDGVWWPRSSLLHGQASQFAGRKFPVNSLFLASPEDSLWR
jgi:hypothetical protein